MKAYEIMNHLESYFPLHLQMDFDKCGLQIGDKNQEISQIFVALNADNDTLQQCIDHHCQMLITHHPFLLEKIDTIDFHQHQGAFIQKAIANHIVVYSLHTCLDRGQNGISMNDWLIEKLNVSDIECYDELQIGKKGLLKQPMTGAQFVRYVKEVFDLPMVKYSHLDDKKIASVAICGGSAADDLEIVKDQVDCYITGDTKYRHAKYAIDHDCLLIDVGHHLEVIFETKLPELLADLPVKIITADSQDYYCLM